MPIYEYRCGNCGHELEAFQKISDDPLVQCPECNEASLVKRISATAFRLKGGGWYETDFKSGNKKNVVESGSDSGSDSKSDSSSSDSSGKDSGSSNGSSSSGNSSSDAAAKKSSSSSDN